MNHQKHITEQNFIQEFQAGNPAGLTYIYDAYSGALYGVLLKMTRNPDLSHDLLQDAFTKMWQQRKKYDADKGALYTWMINLTRNLCIDYLRSKRNKNSDKNQELAPLVYGIEGKSPFDPSHIGVEELLNHLPTEQREVLHLSYFEGYTQKEISEERDIPLGTVKSRAKAALDKLRKMFSKEKQL